MIRKQIQRTIVCWPTEIVNCAFDDASCLEAGQTVYVREDEAARPNGRLPVRVGDREVFCSARQFWASAE
jgi:hypothetical protein